MRSELAVLSRAPSQDRFFDRSREFFCRQTSACHLYCSMAQAGTSFPTPSTIQSRVLRKQHCCFELEPNGTVTDGHPHAAVVLVNDQAAMLVVTSANQYGFSWEASKNAVYTFATQLASSGDFAPDVEALIAAAEDEGHPLQRHEVADLEANRDAPFLSWGFRPCSRRFFDPRIQKALELEEELVRLAPSHDSARRVPIQVIQQQCAMTIL